MFLLTPEQVAAIETFKTGEQQKLQAFAGAGKTSTLVAMAGAKPRLRGVYIAFNKSIADEAARKFAGTGIDAKTVHSLAYRTVAGMGYGKDKMMTNARSRDYKIPHVSSPFGDKMLRVIIASTIKSFLQSGDHEITCGHAPSGAAIREYGAWVNLALPKIATHVWEAMIDPEDPLPMGHDGYLKLWALQSPRIFGDLLLVDEAQDMSPVLIKVIQGQQSQVVAVGDGHQQIYEWRGAVDALKILGGAENRLTQSFRFGAEIARAADGVLTGMGEDHTLTGTRSPGAVHHHRSCAPDAILCRSNAGVIGEAIEMQISGRVVHTPGGTGEIMALIRDAEGLIHGGTPAITPDLLGFMTWQDVQDFAHTEEGTTLRAFVHLVDRYGCHQLKRCLALMANTAHPGSVTISTAHKAKGLEWNTVQLHDDFTVGSAERGPALADRRLFYVAMTRAKRALHVDANLLAAYRS